jgi:hypothetical protein
MSRASLARLARRSGPGLAVFAGYLAISLLYFGRHLLPHPGRALIGLGGEVDPESFVWSFAWWPHAIESWTNPFYTHAAYAPVGINLVWTASVPALALAFAPVTVLFGPDVSYNVAALVLPALAAWTAYRLCRYLTGSLRASLVGGYLFGFSSYTLAEQYAGHLTMTGVFLLPLVALALVRFVRDDLDGRGLAWRLGVLLALQFAISTEVTLTLTVVIALGLILAFALVRSARGRLLHALPPIGAGYLLGGILSSPLIAYAFVGFVPSAFGDPSLFNADLLNVVLPTRLTALGGSTFGSVSSHFPGYLEEQGSYLSVPLLLILVLLAVRKRRSPGIRFLLAGFILTLVLAAGTALTVEGHRVVGFPWALLASSPGFNNVLPERMAVYAALTAAVGVALWIASTAVGRLSSHWLLPTLAVASVVPAFWHVPYTAVPDRPAFFAQGLFKCIPRGETVAIFPFGRWGDSTLWQAESDFWFNMTEGNLTHDNAPANFVFRPVVSTLTFQFLDVTSRPTMAQLRAFTVSQHVDRVVSEEQDSDYPFGTQAYPNETQMRAFGAVQAIGGVYVAPACGHTSLTGDTRGDHP